MNEKIPLRDERISLRVEAGLRELVPGFLDNRRRDLEALGRALHTGDLAGVRSVGRNIRSFSRVLGVTELTVLGEEIQAAADEASTLRIAHLRSQLADYLARVEIAE
jgi:HPt (histidine-containing phosphotransfer) domain-containing protein